MFYGIVANQSQPQYTKCVIPPVPPEANHYTYDGGGRGGRRTCDECKRCKMRILLGRIMQVRRIGSGLLSRILGSSLGLEHNMRCFVVLPSLSWQVFASF